MQCSVVRCKKSLILRDKYKKYILHDDEQIRELYRAIVHNIENMSMETLFVDKFGCLRERIEGKVADEK